MNSDDGNKKEYSRLKAVVHPKKSKILSAFTALYSRGHHSVSLYAAKEHFAEHHLLCLGQQIQPYRLGMT